MSKKRKIATVLILAIMIIVNILIVCYYHPPIDNKKVDIKITLKSDKVKEFELFYLEKTDGEKEEFKAGQVATVKYEKKDTEQILTFSVPAEVEALRLDFGGEASETIISDIQIQYKEESIKIQQTTLKQAKLSKDVQNIEFNEKVTIKADGGDPYLSWSVKSYDIVDMVENQDFVSNIILKLILCIFLDIIVIVCLKYAKVLIGLPLELVHNRRLIIDLAKNDFKTKYAGSYLGIIWAFVQPVVTVLLYWFVFEKGLRAQGINTKAGIEIPFVLWLIAGLVPWFFFQDAVNGASNTLLEYNYLVKKVVFKISILPIVKVISAFFVHAFFIIFMLALYCISGYFPGITAIQILYYSLCTFILALGIGYITCAVVVFFRDLTQIIGIVLQVLMWMTPIMWNMEGMELSPVLITIFKLNPMYYIVNGYRNALINHTWFWEQPNQTLYFWMFAALIFGVGVFVFKKLQAHFADVL